MPCFNRHFALPSEVLYQIIGFAFTEYLDGVVTCPDGLLPVVEAENPAIPLLVTSFQFRDVTLKVLSDSLGICRDTSEKIPKLTAKPWLRISRLRRFFLDSSIVSRGNIDNLFDGMHDSVQELKEASFLVQSYASIPTSELMLMVVPHMPPWQQEMFLDVACKSWKRGFGQIKPEVLMSAIAPRIENLFTFIEKLKALVAWRKTFVEAQGELQEMSDAGQEQHPRYDEIVRDVVSSAKEFKKFRIINCCARARKIQFDIMAETLENLMQAKEMMQDAHQKDLRTLGMFILFDWLEVYPQLAEDILSAGEGVNADQEDDTDDTDEDGSGDEDEGEDDVEDGDDVGDESDIEQ